ncbi:MAG: response regulator [Rhodospirillales bacterium]
MTVQKNSTARILIVDDDISVLKALQRNLKRLAPDWTVAFAQDAGEALMAAKLAPYDVVVTDIRMPAMNGVELLARFAARYPNVLRVAFSEKFDALTTYSITPCPHRYIAKPCDAKDLYTAVSGWLAEHRTHLDLADELARD